MKARGQDGHFSEAAGVAGAEAGAGSRPLKCSLIKCWVSSIWFLLEKLQKLQVCFSSALTFFEAAAEANLVTMSAKLLSGELSSLISGLTSSTGAKDDLRLT